MTIWTATHQETGVELQLNYTRAKAVQDALGVSTEDLADLLTGLNADSYADLAEEALSELNGVEELYEANSNRNDPIYADYHTARTYHRLLNLHNGDHGEVEKDWLDTCKATLNDA